MRVTATAEVAENTIRYRVPAVTGILRPVVTLDVVSPTEMTPGKDIVTVAPETGAKRLLSGVVEAKSCPVIVIGASKDRPSTTLKKPETEVRMPSRGAENAKFVAIPAPPTRLIFEPTSETPVRLFPKPTKEVVPITLPSKPVSTTGRPDANGIIAPSPGAPVAPVAPVAPMAPVAPVAPVVPFIIGNFR